MSDHHEAQDPVPRSERTRMHRVQARRHHRPVPPRVDPGERLPSGPGFVVEIQPGCWLAPWRGNPGRTLVKASAKVYPSRDAAKSALKRCESMGYRMPPNPRILPVDEPPDYSEGDAEMPAPLRYSSVPYRSAVSGLWYEDARAAGTINAVELGGWVLYREEDEDATPWVRRVHRWVEGVLREKEGAKAKRFPPDSPPGPSEKSLKKKIHDWQLRWVARADEMEEEEDAMVREGKLEDAYGIHVRRTTIMEILHDMRMELPLGGEGEETPEGEGDGPKEGERKRGGPVSTLEVDSVDPFPKWKWMMDYCKSKRISPALGWEMAEKAWREASLLRLFSVSDMRRRRESRPAMPERSMLSL